MAASKYNIQAGDRFGKWIVLSFSHQHNGITFWLCRCDCGTKRAVSRYDLAKGKSVSCGCYRAEWSKAAKTTHGLTKSSEYAIWKGMKQRCLSPKCKGYKDYGGRGIQVCERWLNSFENFYADVGPKPPRHSLDRINNDGNYEPTNCRWATQKQQRHNSRCPVRHLTFQDETLPVKDWATRTGIKRATLERRFHAGWTVERLLTTPPRPLTPRTLR